MRVLAMTVCCVDVFPETSEVYVGGNSLNFAVQAKKSGAEKVAILAAVGEDAYGEQIRDYLDSKQVETAYLHTIKNRTASNRIYIDAHGDRYFLPDSWDGGAYEAYRVTGEDLAYSDTFDIVALTYHDPSFAAVYEQKGDYKMVVDYLDSRDYAFLEKVLDKVDISFISGDQEVIDQLLPVSERHQALIVVTLGSKGSAALLNGHVYTCPAESVDQVVDTTGCGDAYQAAFSLEWFKSGNLHKAMKAGSVAAAHVLSHMGGVD